MRQDGAAPIIFGGFPGGMLPLLAMAARATTVNLIVFDGVRIYGPSCRAPAPGSGPWTFE
jgi:hypothetical protein